MKYVFDSYYTLFSDVRKIRKVDLTGCLNLKGFEGVMSMQSYWLMSIRHIAMLSYFFFSISMFSSSRQHLD